ncbi:WASP homolog-associated protein with actin, membranes and microtubules-like isoform X2 [Oppia nitens]|uniref:WASP homolog-associated protein with actin, membranes and microtubules-like isoform X2 n=2 Tax=Oppia nitens TaxID=1686743 RepID=UPI0023D97F8E|nr:WASP homolog-associated protein with actin, membranes and microtubules-like isoform X2 [Oppia nitens]
MDDYCGDNNSDDTIDGQQQQYHSLDGWVAFKADLFANDPTQRTQRLRFLVAVNHLEDTIGITCLEDTRRATDKRNKSMAVSLSADQLVNINKQLSLIRPPLDHYFEPIGQLIQSRDESNSSHKVEELKEEICDKIRQYLDIALTLCGQKLLFTILFDVDFLSDYEEDNQELRLKGYENLLNTAMNELNEVFELKTNVETLLEMNTIYTVEDKAVSNVIIALEELYNFQLQPFRRLRELAHNCIKTNEKLINSSEVGQRVKNEALAEITEAKSQYLTSSEAIQQLYDDYYRKTVDLISGQTDRMRCDQKRFGKTAFRVKGCLTRLLSLEVFVSQEKLQLLNSIKATKVFQRNQLKQEIKENVCKSEKKILLNQLMEMEINCIDSELDILFENEVLINKKKLIIEMDNKLNDYNEEFFDTAEDEEQLKTISLIQEPNKILDHKLIAFNSELKELFQKRANLRSKRKSLIAKREAKQSNEVIVRVSDEKHNKFQHKSNVKISVNKDNEQKFNEMRRKTLERLRNYKLKALLTEAKDNDNNDEEEQQSLPPYPMDTGLRAKCQTLDLPQPPTETEISITEETPKFAVNLEIYPNLPIPPPTPIPPALLPPPPPPPPPPLSLFASQTTFSRPLLKSNNSRVEPKTETNKIGLIDLNDILSVRNKLKPTSQRQQSNDMNENKSMATLEATLGAALQKMRISIKGSDDCHNNNDSDSNDFEDNDFDN